MTCGWLADLWLLLVKFYRKPNIKIACFVNIKSVKINKNCLLILVSAPFKGLIQIYLSSGYMSIIDESHAITPTHLLSLR